LKWGERISKKMFAIAFTIILLLAMASPATSMIAQNNKIPKIKRGITTTDNEPGVIFQPPYTNEGVWESEYNYLVSILKLTSKRKTGFVSALCESYIAGWAEGGAYIEQTIYVGKKKEITVSAEIKCSHDEGKAGIIVSGVSTSKTMSIGNKGWKVELDKFWEWDMFLGVILTVVKIIFPYATVETIADVIDLLSTIEDMVDLYNFMKALEEKGQLETIYMNRTKTVSPGFVPIRVGLSSCAASDLSYAAGVCLGQVLNISIYGMDPPNPAVITGPTKGKVDIMHNFTAVTEDKNGDDVQYKFIWGDGTESSWSEFVPSGTPVTMAHSYSKKGNYVITVEVRDNDYHGAYNPTMKSISDGFNIEIKNNFPPYQLSINGPSKVKIGETSTYQVTAIEPDDDPIYYQFDWFEEQTKWLGPYNSGETISISHSWEDPGTKLVSVRAVDDPNHDGDPSDGWVTDWECLSVEVPHEKNNLPLLKELLHEHLFFLYPPQQLYIKKTIEQFKKHEEKNNGK